MGHILGGLFPRGARRTMTSAARRKILRNFTTFGRRGFFIHEGKDDIKPDEHEQDDDSVDNFHGLTARFIIISQPEEKKKSTDDRTVPQDGGHTDFSATLVVMQWF